MAKIKVIYWSGTGNTEAMADLIAKGIEEGGKEAEVIEISNCTPDSLKDDATFALGCPAMGAEELEETIVEPFVAELEAFCSGKNIALFGSYSWADGEWMTLWQDRMSDAGANVIDSEGLICFEGPDDDDKANACIDLGKSIAAL